MIKETIVDPKDDGSSDPIDGKIAGQEQYDYFYGPDGLISKHVDEKRDIVFVGRHPAGDDQEYAPQSDGENA